MMILKPLGLSHCCIHLLLKTFYLCPSPFTDCLSLEPILGENMKVDGELSDVSVLHAFAHFASEEAGCCMLGASLLDHGLMSLE